MPRPPLVPVLRGLAGAAAAAVLLAAAACGLELPLPYPALDADHPPRQPTSTQGPIRAHFLGVTSLLFQDEATSILSDGFVTRPGEGRVLLGRIRPNETLVDSTVSRLGMGSLAAVFCGHSHYDHCLDAPAFARRTGAVLLGSPSTASVGRGYGLPEPQLYVVRDGETRRFGRFELTFIAAAHSVPDRVPGIIPRPLRLPARKDAWKTGEATYSVHIRHGNRTLLVHGSAAFRPHALRRCRAEVVYLGIWGLGAQREEDIDGYWNEVVRAAGARRVIPVHWDFFFRSLDDGLRPFPFSAASFQASMRHVLRRARNDGVEVLMPVPWLPTDPFAGLPEPAPADPSRPLCTRNDAPSA